MIQKTLFLFIKRDKLLIYIVTIAAVLILSAAMIKATQESISHDHSLSGKIIVIDPGHGGVDSGAHYNEKILEKDINLGIGLKLKHQLQQKNTTVIMTRETDDSLDDHIKNGSRHREDLDARVGTINKNHADVFVSIHVNSMPGSPSTLGPMVFYYGNSEKSQKLADCIQQSLNGLSSYSEIGDSAKHSAAKGNYVLLSESSSPGVIVETGFISNKTDRTLLQQEIHQQECAVLIAQGIIDYFKE